MIGHWATSPERWNVRNRGSGEEGGEGTYRCTGAGPKQDGGTERRDWTEWHHAEEEGGTRRKRETQKKEQKVEQQHTTQARKSEGASCSRTCAAPHPLTHHLFPLESFTIGFTQALLSLSAGLFHSLTRFFGPREKRHHSFAP